MLRIFRAVAVHPGDVHIFEDSFHSGTELVGRQNLLTIKAPEPTDTRKPITHAESVGAVVETLAYDSMSRTISHDPPAQEDGGDV